MNQIRQQLLQPFSTKPLALFRIVFGALMAWELLHYRFFRNEVDDFLIDPTFHFSYQLTAWIPNLSPGPFELFYWLLVGLFVLLSVGWQYRFVKIACFIGWSWLFFMERTLYFNHWYLAMLVLFLLLFLPANQVYSADAIKDKHKDQVIPFWCTGTLALLTGLVYFFSGTAKLNPDWLIGQPLTLVFSLELGHLPTVFQEFMKHSTVGLLGSYVTIFLELCALPLLIWRRSRLAIVILLVGFNLLNLFFFPVGIFPLLMIALTLLWLPLGQSLDAEPTENLLEAMSPNLKRVLALFFIVQLLLPARRIIYQGSQLWAEEGLLFSWPMFTTYKGGDVVYLVRTDENTRLDTIYPRQLDLTDGQYIRLVKNPDCIVQYAHHIGQLYTEKGASNVAVYCDAFLHLNGRSQQRFIHPNINLLQERRRVIAPYPWVLPLEGSRLKHAPNR